MRRFMQVHTPTQDKEFTNSSLTTPILSGDQRPSTTGSTTPDNLGQILKSKASQRRKETVKAIAIIDTMAKYT